MIAFDFKAHSCQFTWQTFWNGPCSGDKALIYILWNVSLVPKRHRTMWWMSGWINLDDDRFPTYAYWIVGWTMCHFRACTHTLLESIIKIVPWYYISVDTDRLNIVMKLSQNHFCNDAYEHSLYSAHFMVSDEKQIIICIFVLSKNGQFLMNKITLTNVNISFILNRIIFAFFS